MPLGILEPRVEHVPGTVYVYESEQRQAELLQSARHLKKDKTGRIILVPQPSDDPNDPLVRRNHNACEYPTLTVLIELASLATRRDPRHSLLCLLSRDDCISSTGSRFCHSCNCFPANIPGGGSAHSLPPVRRGRGRMAFRRISKSMGQKTSISAGLAAHDRKFGMGWV